MGIALRWHCCCSAVPVRRTCTWCLARLEFAVPAQNLNRTCTLVTSVPLAHCYWCFSPAQMTDRMEVEPSLTLSNDLKRACELLERLQRSKYCGEVPATKLAALHKVLQSEFLNAVREVYEHIYETVEVDGSPDIRASATAKATVAAFAASEGHAHPRVVELPKTEEGLGFNVMGGKEQNSPIYISRIIPGGVADRHGGLKRGDQLLSVNGVSVEGEPHEKAVELLKAALTSVKLVVRYTPKVLEEMELRFDKQRKARQRQMYSWISN